MVNELCGRVPRVFRYIAIDAAITQVLGDRQRIVMIPGLEIAVDEVVCAHARSRVAVEQLYLSGHVEYACAAFDTRCPCDANYGASDNRCMRLMEKLKARVVSVHAGSNEDLSKDAHQTITVELDGIVGDRHRGFDRVTWAGDKQPEGTRRRNERQWSAMSVEEIDAISQALDLEKPLSAGRLGANLCLEGVARLSRLPKGTTLRFPSGAELIVEEYNPPCHDMGKQVAASCRTRAGQAPESTAFPKAAKLTRGVVGVVEVPGTISVDDEVDIEVYELPGWLSRSSA